MHGAQHHVYRREGTSNAQHHHRRLAHRRRVNSTVASSSKSDFGTRSQKFSPTYRLAAWPSTEPEPLAAVPACTTALNSQCTISKPMRSGSGSECAQCCVSTSASARIRSSSRCKLGPPRRPPRSLRTQRARAARTEHPPSHGRARSPDPAETRAHSYHTCSFHKYQHVQRNLHVDRQHLDVRDLCNPGRKDEIRCLWCTLWLWRADPRASCARTRD